MTKKELANVLYYTIDKLEGNLECDNFTQKDARTVLILAKLLLDTYQNLCDHKITPEQALDTIHLNMCMLANENDKLHIILTDDLMPKKLILALLLNKAL